MPITKNKHLWDASNTRKKSTGWAVSQSEKKPLREDAHKGFFEFHHPSWIMMFIERLPPGAAHWLKDTRNYVEIEAVQYDRE